MRRSFLLIRLLLMAFLLWHGLFCLGTRAVAEESAKPENAGQGVISLIREPVAWILDESKAKVLRYNLSGSRKSLSAVVSSSSPSVERSDQQGWQVIMTEDFEGLFPHGAWYAGHSTGLHYSRYYWGKDDYNPRNGQYSAWCAGDHDIGFPDLDPATNNYPNDMSAWMIWGPFSLSDATDAEFQFYYWLDSEPNFDYFSRMASINGSNFYGLRTSGSSSGWVGETFDLTNVYQLGDLTGQPEVWVAFMFQSNAAQAATGAFVDDIVVRKEVIANQPPTIVHTPVVTAQTGQDVTIAANITDDGGVTGANVHYRKSGQTSYSTVAMSAAGDHYTGLIPDSVVTSVGVDYYLSATDGLNTSYHPPINWQSSPHVIQVADQAPTIIHTPVTTALEGTDMTVSATITDDGGVTGADLYYRRGGQTSFTTVSMTATRADYSGIIPGGSVTSRGVEYYISATDGANTAYDPTVGFQTSPHVTQVQVDSLTKNESQPGGSDQTAYRMISVPLELDNAGADAVLSDDLGSYDNTQWRLLRYEDGSYLEYSSAGDFAPGKAFWLIVRASGKTIDAGSGTTVTTADSFAITLSSGWNDIGLPFDFGVLWSDVSVDTANINGPYLYDGEWKLPQSISQLEPWKGYAIKNLTDSDIVLKIPPVSRASATCEPPSHMVFEERPSVQWCIRLSAQCEQARDGINYLGCSQVALQERDCLDLSEPPPVGSFVSLYFPHLDWDRYPDRLTVDFRPPVEKVQIWEFVVESNIPNSTVRLSWDNIENLPIGLNASLIDKEENIALDLRARQSYSFASGGGKEFLLVVGSDTNERHSRASLPKEYTLYQNFPNPFNPVTTISFDVPEKTKIELSLFNVLGKEVKILADGIYPAGHHEIDIDARNLCAGVYFYRMKASGFADVKKMVLLK